ncbi:BA14K-like protein [Rhizobium aethiopicum]|uniref:Lectin-like protein BA14k n=1 Tax=Rhizobium aethiopicum TaxID=1138170 RepID=A0A1C3XYA2_9HYPH|nr:MULTISPECIES: BA14K family protein [Rhizobium]SCB56996.1 BA14K-like protein [Rhizobium aethiopicum]
MTAIATVAFGIVSSVGACMAAASIASHVMADYRPHAFTDLAGPDLWTTRPVKIDPRQQQYERIPPVYSSYVTAAPATVVSQPARPSKELQTPQRKFAAEHLAWCAKRYRSFDPATNSYRSYSGETRECSSPFQQTIAEGHEPGSMNVNAQAAARCAARYRSYRPEDNTYQPWEGPRRSCNMSNLVATSN